MYKSGRDTGQAREADQGLSLRWSEMMLAMHMQHHTYHQFHPGHHLYLASCVWLQYPVSTLANITSCRLASPEPQQHPPNLDAWLEEFVGADNVWKMALMYVHVGKDPMAVWMVVHSGKPMCLIKLIIDVFDKSLAVV